ncbi:MAG: hypothetical protein WC565_05290 [Parcubacteria group bacterium]|jgi:hypothetical protein
MTDREVVLATIHLATEGIGRVNYTLLCLRDQLQDAPEGERKTLLPLICQLEQNLAGAETQARLLQRYVDGIPNFPRTQWDHLLEEEP